MSSKTRLSPIIVLGRVVVLVIAVVLGLFTGVVAVSFGVFLSHSWTSGVQTSDLIAVLLSACVYALLYSLVQLQRRLIGELNSGATRAAD